MQVKEREASGASALDSAAPVPLRVVTRVPVAFRLHPLGNLEFVVELKHDLLLFGKEREPVSWLPLRVKLQLAS
jgi:hypothetical protein